MARQGRKRSGSGIYHIMMRGIDKRDIFMEEEDKIKFLEKLILTRDTTKFLLYGYCLMDNHIHLLIKESEEIGDSIRRISVGYVQWHNNKYGRIGHLFQNRFVSEPVETESYLIGVLRYIHRNPVKAKMVRYCNNYLWSSYNEYLYAYNNQESSIDISLIRAYFKTWISFEKFMNTPNDDQYLEFNRELKFTDEELKNFILKKTDIGALKDMSPKDRGKEIRGIYEETNVSIRQLGRVTGLGKGVVERALRQDK